jgi:AcrR family transcriptional regulator
VHPALFAASAVDGRTARKNTNKDAVVDAALKLFEAGNKHPKMEDIAAAAGVSVRSAYRYFSNVEEITQAAAVENLAKYGALFEVEKLGIGTLDERIRNLVSSRMRLFDEAHPMIMAVMVHRYEDNFIGNMLGWRLQHMYLQNLEMFSSELSRLPALESQQVAAALDGILSFDNAESMRRRLGFTSDAVADAMMYAFHRLLDPASAQGDLS